MVFDEVAYFTTVVGTGSFCDSGYGRVWGIDYDGIGGSDTVVEDVLPELDVDGNPLTNDKMPYIEYPNSKALGLQLIQRPSCFETPDDYEPTTGIATKDGTQPPPAGTWDSENEYGTSPSGTTAGMSFSGASGGNVELVIQTGDTGTSSPKMSVPDGSGTSTTGNKAIQKLKAPGQTVFSMSWSLVFD